MRNVGECDAWDPYDEVKITFECEAQIVGSAALSQQIVCGGWWFIR